MTQRSDDRADDDRVSLAPLDAETALRALLAVDPAEASAEEAQATGEKAAGGHEPS